MLLNLRRAAPDRVACRRQSSAERGAAPDPRPCGACAWTTACAATSCALVQATRAHGDLALGASPRGSLALYRGGAGRAAVHGRDYVLPDDIQALAQVTLAHRCILKPESALRGRTAPAVIADILAATPLDLGSVEQ